MVAISSPGPLRPLHPLHAIVLAFPFPLFLGALLSDLAYRSSFHVQWANFSSWLAMWGLGFVNALVHAKDAWATMPEGLYLSATTTLLALVAAWIGYSGFRAGEVE